MDKIDYSFEKLKIARRKQLKKKNFSEAMRLKLEGQNLEDLDYPDD
jgi:hypothetical protein